MQEKNSLFESIRKNIEFNIESQFKTTEQFCFESDIDKSVMYRFLKGETSDIKFSTLYRIAKGLGKVLEIKIK